MSGPGLAGDGSLAAEREAALAAAMDVAQTVYRDHPTPENKAAYRAAAEELAEHRREGRQLREAFEATGADEQDGEVDQ